MKPKCKTLQTYLPQDIADLVEEEAGARGLSVSSWLRMLILSRFGERLGEDGGEKGSG